MCSGEKAVFVMMNYEEMKYRYVRVERCKTLGWINSQKNTPP